MDGQSFVEELSHAVYHLLPFAPLLGRLVVLSHGLKLGIFHGLEFSNVIGGISILLLFLGTAATTVTMFNSRTMSSNAAIGNNAQLLELVLKESIECLSDRNARR